MSTVLDFADAASTGAFAAASLPAPLRADFSLTRYQASALLTFQFNKTAIQRLVTAANDAVMTELREVA